MSGKKIDRVSLFIFGCAAVILLAAAGLLVSFMMQSREDARRDALVITLDATVRANVTNIPLATPLSQADSADYVEFQRQIASCADYSPERKSQMLLHMEWLVNPSTIPADAITAFGSNVQETLVFGMAGYTSIQWRLLNRPADSCLIEIGQQLDVMLANFGGTPLGIYGQ
jgi:hypothetical protein